MAGRLADADATASVPSPKPASPTTAKPGIRHLERIRSKSTYTPIGAPALPALDVLGRPRGPMGRQANVMCARIF